MSVQVQAVVFDLDGTILDTESLCFAVGKQVVARYGKELTKEVARKALGKRPVEAWAAIAHELELEATAQQLVDETEPLLQQQWHGVKVLPGAVRLVEHLHRHGVPLAIATSTSRASFACKMATHAELRDKFQVVVCGDEVRDGKPAPDIYLAAAEGLGVPPERCLALEDALTGVEPSKFQLPPFDDHVHGTVPLRPRWLVKGPVIKGFGRGSKQLGIPTANLGEDALDSLLGDAVSGIYYGWASVGDSTAVNKMVMSVGWNPFYQNEHRTCEPWILHDFENDFYGEELRLVVCGYIRPEANFESLEALIERIHEDGRVTKLCLEDPQFSPDQYASFLAPGKPAALAN